MVDESSLTLTRVFVISSTIINSLPKRTSSRWMRVDGNVWEFLNSHPRLLRPLFHKCDSFSSGKVHIREFQLRKEAERSEYERNQLEWITVTPTGFTHCRTRMNEVWRGFIFRLVRRRIAFCLNCMYGFVKKVMGICYATMFGTRTVKGAC